MTLEEFRNEFDILYNNIASNAAPPIDDYEKSVFLTLAQEELVKQLYNGNNEFGLSFESTEESREYLSELVKEFLFTNKSNTNICEFKKEFDFMYILREVCTLKNTKCNIGEVDVVPSTLDDLSKTLRNPFKGPSNNRVIRVNIEDKIRLYSNDIIDTYVVTYLKKPQPIILSYLEDVSINGIQEETPCELNPILHRTILNSAVALAKATYVAN